MTRIKIVVGCGFGDEGKGQTTYALCNDIINKEKVIPVVYRFSGGQQAGHTVVTKSGLKHVFSCFGSGTFLGCPTIWGERCVMDPLQWLLENEDLKKKIDTIPLQYFHPNTRITTPYDVIFNQVRRIGGTVGKGVWETIKRDQEGLSLFYEDLKFPRIVNAKLQSICNYYADLDRDSEKYSLVDTEKIIQYFTEFYRATRTFSNDLLDSYIVYEGSQGVLLDPKYGLNSNEFKTPISCIPYWEMLPKEATESDVSMYYVCRTYLTKHGSGSAHGIKQYFLNRHETNVDNKFQGTFKHYLFDSQFINYSISCVERSFKVQSRYIVQTCGDVVSPCDLSKALSDLNLIQICTHSPDFDTLCK